MAFRYLTEITDIDIERDEVTTITVGPDGDCVELVASQRPVGDAETARIRVRLEVRLEIDDAKILRDTLSSAIARAEEAAR